MTTATIVQDRRLAERIRAERQAAGADRWDEVWDGTYLLMPLPNIEHQEIVTRLTTVLDLTIGFPGLGRVFAGVNVTDRPADWTKNYRCPDVAVYLNDTAATFRGAHSIGGPDFAVEVVSEDDRSRDKLEFYARVGTRELLLLIDRDPWALELYRLDGDVLGLVGRSEPPEGPPLPSALVPLTFRLAADEAGGRPRIVVGHADGVQSWRI